MVRIQLDMTREKAHGLIDSLVEVHVDELRGHESASVAVTALSNAKADFHSLIDTIYDELDMQIRQHTEQDHNRSAGW